MLTDEVAAFGDMDMRLTRLTFALAIITTATACTAERAVSPASAKTSVATTVGPASLQVPMLYVVDGVRLQRDQVPTLTGDEISAVHVIKGHAALKQYGPDASYGVVVITTKNAPRS